VKNIQAIIDLFGGLPWLQKDNNYIRLQAPGFMRLVIEYIGTGPRDLPAISVAHYGEQNGDAMRDPEIVFEVDWTPQSGWGPQEWGPISFRNDYLGICQEGEAGAVFVGDDGKVKIRPRLVQDLKAFARQWDRNIQDQGFVDAAREAVAKQERSAS
jgi:hypothetical protein